MIEPHLGFQHIRDYVARSTSLHGIILRLAIRWHGATGSLCWRLAVALCTYTSDACGFFLFFFPPTPFPFESVINLNVEVEHIVPRRLRYPRMRYVHFVFQLFQPEELLQSIQLLRLGSVLYSIFEHRIDGALDLKRLINNDGIGKFIFPHIGVFTWILHTFETLSTSLHFKKKINLQFIVQILRYNYTISS